MEHQFTRPPMPHQLDAFERSKDMPYYGYLFDPGLGKTFVNNNNAIYLWDRDKIDSMIVIAPNGVHRNWEDEINGIPGLQEPDFPELLSRDIFIWDSGSLVAERRRLDAALAPPPTGKMHILLMNVEACSSARGQEYLERFIMNHTPLLTLDESTTIKHHDSARSKFLIRMSRRVPYRRILTGSFTDNSPMDAYGQLDFLSPAILGYCTFVVFRARYGVMRKGIRAGFTQDDIDRGNSPNATPAEKKKARGATFMDLVGYRNLEDLRARMLPYVSIVDKSILGLPEKLYRPLYVLMTPKQSAVYQQMKLESIATIERQLAEKAAARQPKQLTDQEMQTFIDATKAGAPIALAPPTAEALEIFNPATSSTAKIVLSQMMRLHQIACGFIKTDDGVEHPVDETNPSIDALLDKLELLPGKVIIWANYRYNIREIAEAIGKRFGPETVATYYGATTQDERTAIRQEFRQLGTAVKYLVANPASAGRGLTLLDPTVEAEFQYSIYYSNDYDAERRRQSEDRDHRKGQWKTCIYIDIIRVGTVDVKILKAHRTKEDLNKIITASNWRQFIA